MKSLRNSPLRLLQLQWSTSRDFVPWRFSNADRPRVGRAQHLGVRETYTEVAVGPPITA